MALNFLLGISLFILSNMAILTGAYGAAGDVVYLIIAIILVVVFSSPLLADALIYGHCKPGEKNKFNELFSNANDHSGRKNDSRQLPPLKEEKPSDNKPAKTHQSAGKPQVPSIALTSIPSNVIDNQMISGAINT